MPHELDELRREIVETLQRARQTHAFEEPALREAVRRFAVAARAAGLPPEKLVIAIKQLVAEEVLKDVGDWFRGVVTDRTVAWAIEGYFDLD